MVGIGASAYVLLPKENLVFSPIGSQIYEQLYEYRSDLPEVYRRLVYELDRGWTSNDETMQTLFRGFRYATAALALQIVLLVVVVSGTLV